jgi:CDP-glycerol glycerophosphotransferase
VVPFHNVADVLRDCLQSIATQTFRDLEVIMVDDGSTDASTAIAQAQADTDHRFHLLRVPNGGPGYARNRGIERARGEFLAFVDGDDMLPRGAYDTLLDTVAKSGSDFACGNVYRFGPWGIMPSGMHARAIKGRRIATHISRAPQLLYDMAIWNKLFRKDFWDRHGLRFPEGVVYEDVQLATRAHVLARAVDIIPDFVYHWRHRGQGTFSITQSRTDIGNLRDRLGALLANDRFLAQHGSAKLLRRHQRKALGNDIWLYAGELTRVDDGYRAEFLDLVNSYLDQVRPGVLSRLTAAQKLAYYLIRAAMLPELLEFLAWLDEEPRGMVPVVRKFGRLRADLPFRGDPRLGIPGKVFRPYWRELDPFVRVEEISWPAGPGEGDGAAGNGKATGPMRITGRAYIPSVSITKRRHTSKIVLLRPRGRLRPPLVLRARSFRHPEATALSGQERYCYEWAGFRFELSPRLFRLAGRWLTGDWECYLLVRGRGVWRPARIHTPMLGQPEHPDFRDLGQGLRFRARWEGRNLVVGLVKVPAIAAGQHADGGALAIDVDLRGQAQLAGEGQPVPGAGSGAGLVLRREGGAARLVFPAEPAPARAAGPAGRPAAPGNAVTRLRGRVEIDALVAELGVADRVAQAENAEDGVAWDVYVRPAGGGGTLRVAAPSRLAESRFLRGKREIAVGRSRYGNLVISERTPRPVIDGYSWRQDGCLELRGSMLGREGEPLEAVLSRRGAGERHRFAVDRDGERFTIEIDVGRVPSFGYELPLRDGTWDIFVCSAGAAGAAGDADTADGTVGVKYDHAKLAEVSEEAVDVGPKQYRFMVADYDTPVITAEARRRLSEKGKYAQRVLRKAYYPVQFRAPLRDAIVFISWKGKQCTDNPRGIADELRRRGDDREHIWVVTDPATPLPEGATVVLANTQAYFEALARSRYVIANDDMPPHYRKRDGQTYLQTWHGTPLKRIGFDVPRPQFASGATYLDHLADDVAKWDLLLSPNSFSTPIMRRAFHFDGEVCEYGYPRNDLMSRSDSAQLAGTVRERLGLPDGKRVVLYAPTWRDNQFYASGRYRFDLRLDLERAWRALGDDYVILLRGHHQMAEDVPDAAQRGFAVNVTRYPDISELYLASDVLVTDYSSVMFDYATTGRPMLFFTYDLDDYRDNLRGFYFDFEKEAPGPLLSTSDDVIAAIKDTDGVAASYAAAYQAFAAKFCGLDDGKAGARVCDRLFGP